MFFRWFAESMPELPEITVIAKQMNKEIRGKQIAEVEVRQPKILNMSVAEFSKMLTGRVVEDVCSHGKWILARLDHAYRLLINLGMGAELIRFRADQKLPERFQFRLTFSDGTGFTANFWWFGYVHLLPDNHLSSHKMTAKLGKSATDETFTLEYFKESLTNKKTTIKNFLLDQRNVAGIGNVYVQDILFKAKLHPNRKIPTITEKEVTTLYGAVQEVLRKSIRLGGLAYERDFYGRKGRFTSDHFLVGYRQGKPCPECDTTIEKIKTGTTSSYICTNCQARK
jgi:formamidopyrimidine-DNA glycosylase